MSRPVENLWDVAGGPRANGPNVSPILSTEITWSVSQKPCSDAIQEAHSSSVIIQLNEQRISCIFMYTVYHSLPFPAIFHLFSTFSDPFCGPCAPLDPPFWIRWGRLGEGLGGAVDQAGAHHEGHAPGEQCASLGADEGGTGEDSYGFFYVFFLWFLWFLIVKNHE